MITAPKPYRGADCPSFHDYTPCPDGYLDWHAWAKRMMKTHRQVRCTACGLLTIWVPKPGKAPAASHRR